jgi:catechol 2,3-dioxygenase-like lactoylglutathione lyase family enzyme
VIERIGHINIRTPLLEETLAFYEQLFDLMRGPAATMADQTRNAWLHDRDGRAIIHVNMPGPDEPAIAAGSPSRLDHVAFDIADLAGMEARLTARDIPYRRLASRIEGLTQLVLRDPNGVVLELAHGTDRALNPAVVGK